MKGTCYSGWGTPGTVPSPPPLAGRTRSAPPQLRSVQLARAGARICCAGARERAPQRGSAPRGEPEQDGGRAEAAAWAEAAAAWSAEPRRLGRATPGPAASDPAKVGPPHPFPPAAASEHIRPGRGAATTPTPALPGPSCSPTSGGQPLSTACPSRPRLPDVPSPLSPWPAKPLSPALARQS